MKKCYFIIFMSTIFFISSCSSLSNVTNESRKSEKSILIIGAGIAGLSAGCYAQMNGYQATIFELHDKPGGLCTSWRRNGYTIDGSIHQLAGSAPGNVFHKFWKELGVIQGRQMVNHEEYMRIKGSDGKEFIAYTNTDRLEKHMLELSPRDAKLIKKFTKSIRKLSGFGLPEKSFKTAGFIHNFKFILKARPYLFTIMKWKNVSIQEFAAKFEDPFLRKAFPEMLLNNQDFPMIAVIGKFVWMNDGTAGYPIGGSLELARSIEKRFVDLNGNIQYKSRVNKILVKDDVAVGVQLEDGSKHYGDIVISAADGHSTIFDMLEGKYINKKIKNYYNNMPIYKPLVYVGIGVDNELEGVPHRMRYLLDKPLEIAGIKYDVAGVRTYSYDPTMSPKGKNIISMMFKGDYNFWKEIYNDRKKYEEEKEKIELTLIHYLDSLYPGISKQIEMVDVATPMTFERYTANWKGSFEGWLITTENLMLLMKKTLPGLNNFYMAGQWVQQGGGLPSGVMTAREAIQMICKKDDKKFKTSEP